VPGSSFYGDPADGARQVRFRVLQDRRHAFRRRRAPFAIAAGVVRRPPRTPCRGYAKMRRANRGEIIRMALEFHLIAPNTLVEANGEGKKVDVGASATRTFLCTMAGHRSDRAGVH